MDRDNHVVRVDLRAERVRGRNPKLRTVDDFVCYQNGRSDSCACTPINITQHTT
jgi:hypothetical protein